MNTATHSVVVPFPQAFASPLPRKKRSPFPSAPRYGADMSTREDNRSLDGYSASFEIIRSSLLLVLWLLRSCFYLKERFTLEPANMIQLSKYYRYILAQGDKSGKMSVSIFIHPWLESTGLSKKMSSKQAARMVEKSPPHEDSWLRNLHR